MTRIIGNSDLQGGARLLQIGDVPTDMLPASGQWHTLSIAANRLALPAFDFSGRERWLAFILPAATATALPTLRYGTPCEIAGPFGGMEPAMVDEPDRRRILLADDAGLAALLLAARLEPDPVHLALLALRETPPVRIRPSRYVVPDMPAGAIAGLAPLEDLGIASRIARPEQHPGCIEGGLAELIDACLGGTTARWRWDTSLCVFGRTGTIDSCRELLRGRMGRLHTACLPVSPAPV